MSVHYTDEHVTVHAGDCLDVLKTLPDNSVDAVCTDPPYGLEFMGKDWDRPWAVSPTQSVGFVGRETNLTLPSFGDNRNANCRGCGGRQRGAKRCECAAPKWDRDPASDMREFQSWCEQWATECLRVLKPGGHMLAFGGTRTWHRLACAVEDAGFEIRDSIAWLYGSGFPKSLDVSKAIDKAAGAERDVIGKYTVPADSDAGNAGKVICGIADASMFGCSAPSDGRDITAPATDAAKQWQGWGTALKPSHEPIVVARKPIQGTVAANVQAWGTGALNIDGCRVGTTKNVPASPRGEQSRIFGKYGAQDGTESGHDPNVGRWPSNVVLDGDMADELDRQSGVTKSPAPYVQQTKAEGEIFPLDKFGKISTHHGDEGGASRFFPVFKQEEQQCTETPMDGSTNSATDAEDAQRSTTPKTPAAGESTTNPAATPTPDSFPTFKYTAKAPGAERPTAKGVSGEHVAHPT